MLKYVKNMLKISYLTISIHCDYQHPTVYPIRCTTLILHPASYVPSYSIAAVVVAYVQV